MSDGRLTSRAHWEAQWKQRRRKGLGFDPTAGEFAEVHALLQRHLPKGGGRRVLEVGAYPGNYLWYFARYFDYEVHGLEYLAGGCEDARALLHEAAIDAHIHEGDLFEFEVDEDARFDVVASFGFVEHFADPTEAIERHIGLLEPGGHLVLTVPNHSGLNGRVLWAIDREAYRAHNRMSAEDLQATVQRAGGIDVLEVGYYGHFGLRNTGLYTKLSRAPRPVYVGARAPLYVLERAAQWLPNTRWLAPMAALVGRKR